MHGESWCEYNYVDSDFPLFRIISTCFARLAHKRISEILFEDDVGGVFRVSLCFVRGVVYSFLKEYPKRTGWEFSCFFSYDGTLNYAVRKDEK